MEQEKYQSKYNMHFETGSNPTILNDVRIDKIEVSARGNFGAALRGRIDEAKDDADNKPDNDPPDGKVAAARPTVKNKDIVSKDERFRRAVLAVQDSPYFKYQYDWTWAKVAMADDRVGLTALQTDELIRMLAEIKVSRLPKPIDINKHYCKVHRKGQAYTFEDTNKDNETERRNKIIITFIREYNNVAGSHPRSATRP